MEIRIEEILHAHDVMYRIHGGRGFPLSKMSPDIIPELTRFEITSSNTLNKYTIILKLGLQYTIRDQNGNALTTFSQPRTAPSMETMWKISKYLFF